MDDKTRALLGDREAAKRLTDAGVLLPCCGVPPILHYFDPLDCYGIECGGNGHIHNTGFCDSEYEASLAWNTRAPMPTLTPPNEPLTWNELGNMIEKPVYIVELEDGESCWVLVHTVDDIKALFVSAFDQYDYGNRELYGQTWLVYRRPPEGEADD